VCRLLLRAWRLRPKRVHSARIPAQEITVTYPFHPLTGQTFVLAGQYEHGGVEHVLVRRKDGATFIFPAWMTGEAGLARIVADPRLPVNRLIELRELVDRIMIASSAGNPAAAGEHHEERKGYSTGSVPSAYTVNRPTRAFAQQGGGPTPRASDGGNHPRPRRARGKG